MAANPPAEASPLQAFETQLQAYLPDITKLLPKTISPERFLQVCMNAVLANPQLREVITKESSARRTFFAEAMKCATDGLVPDGREAAFTHFKMREVGTVVKYMPMVAGILKKVRNSGEIASISVELVHEKDEFEYQMGDDEKIVHRRPPFGTDRGAMVGVYAIVRTHKDGIYREVMDATQIAAVRAASRSGSGGPWAGPFEGEMWKKSVLRRISKRLPMSSDIAGVVMRDDDLYDLGTPTGAIIEAEPQPRVQAAKTREAMGLSVAPPSANPVDPPSSTTPDGEEFL